MNSANIIEKDYLLGHTEVELNRLTRQGNFLYELTRNFLISAGISEGMRVLDFGAGSGDVSLILSELVGDAGEVIAVDRALESHERTKNRLQSLNIKNVTFYTGDEYSLGDIFKNQPADAVAGRLVLVHQRDPVSSFCEIVKCVRPGGIVAFQEIDLGSGIWSNLPLPLMEKVFGWLTQTFIAADKPRDMAAQLIRAFDITGIESRHIIREGIYETGDNAVSFTFFEDIMKPLIPIMDKLNIVKPEEVQVDTLAERLRHEALAHHAHFITAQLVGAYGHLPT